MGGDMNKERMKAVEEIQKEFIYDRHETEGYIVYHCHKPGTSNYSFEIFIGKMGIYAGGDINSLVFRVARGIDFLAGDDVDYYIYSKLDHIYLDQKELSKCLIESFLRETLWEAVEDLSVPNELESPPDNLEDTVKYYKDNNLNVPSWSMASNKDDKHTKAWDLYQYLYECSDLIEAYRIIYGSPLYQGEMPSIAQPSESVMFTLYMVNHAAKKILFQEAKA
jgi:hypothetical protein